MNIIDGLLSRRPEKGLFHYTTAEGLIGITTVRLEVE